jgi:diacylglycerol O-acyltransferase / wax synthase
MERLRALDAEFLHLEDASSPMHIASLSIFEGPAPERAQMEALARSVIERVPRYRQRLQPAGGLAAPCWSDDPAFNIDYHLRFTALPSPHDERALCELMGRLMSQLLDRERPLWECWVVEGLAEGRWAMIGKVHHSFVDGLSGVGLMSTWLDPLPVAPPAASRPEAHASPARRKPPQPGRPHSSLQRLLEAGRGFARLAGAMRLTRNSSLQGKVGAHRAYAFASVSLDDVHRVRAALGGTVNDVVLALLTQAYRTLMLRRGDDPSGGPLRALVPVSTRKPNDHGGHGNQVAALFCDLPVDLDQPLARLRAVSSRTQELKQSSRIAEATDSLVQLADRLPAGVLAAATRAVARTMHRFPQRSVGTITTHVRGPEQALHCLGRPMLEYYPLVPIMQGVRVGSAVLSYHGRLGFGFNADYGSVPEIDIAARAVESELAALLAIARLHAARPADNDASLPGQLS